MRVLVIETTKFGYDGITSVITNYYKYQNHERVYMDLVTINPISTFFKDEIDKYGTKNFVLPYRNQNPIRYIFELIKIIKKGKYQIVHVHGCSATMAVEMFASKIAGVKIRISHSHNTKCDHVKIDKLLRPIFNTFCNVRFACGKEAGEWMFPGKDFSIISNGIDLEKYQYDENIRFLMRKQYDLDNKFVVGHVGRFTTQKNHKKLIDIFKEITKEFTNAKLVLLGDGEQKEEIEHRVKKDNLDVLFVGVSDEVEKWLQAIDIIIFPSLFEGLPLVIVEAQAAGLPCILSNTISKDTKLTDLVSFVELDSAPSVWLTVVKNQYNSVDRVKQKEIVKQQIQDSHFDITYNCRILADKYENLIEERRN